MVDQEERGGPREDETHGLEMARERGVVGGQGQRFKDQAIEETVEKFGVNGAAKRLKCSKVTVIVERHDKLDGGDGENWTPLRLGVRGHG